MYIPFYVNGILQMCKNCYKPNFTSYKCDIKELRIEQDSLVESIRMLKMRSNRDKFNNNRCAS